MSLKKICLFGSESVGKTTLAAELAAHFNTAWVPEMARAYLGDRKCVFDDFVWIARWQTTEVLRKSLVANRVLICDTDVLTTELYARIYFDDVPQEVIDLQKVINYDLFLFLEADVPWVSDTQRDLGDPAIRENIRNMFFEALVSRNLPYEIIKGDWQTRKEKAIAAIEALIDR